MRSRMTEPDGAAFPGQTMDLVPKTALRSLGCALRSPSASRVVARCTLSAGFDCPGL
jgi:hypothetical protein